MKKPDAIFTADWHLTDRTPPCRTDDYMATSFKKISQIIELQDSFSDYFSDETIPIVIAGDVFDQWKPSLRLLCSSLIRFPENVICIPGNHDLPNHNVDRFLECGLSVLDIGTYSTETILDPKKTHSPDGDHICYHGFPFGSDFHPLKRKIDSSFRNIAVIHEFAYKGRSPFPGATGKVTSIMNKLKGYDVIVCGDNHKPFTHEKDGQLFVNPGSLMRMTAAQIKHRPRVYLYYADENRVDPYYLDIDPKAVKRDHIDIPKEQMERTFEFVDKLNTDFELGLSFKKNMREFLLTNELPKLVKTKIAAAMEG